MLPFQISFLLFEAVGMLESHPNSATFSFLVSFVSWIFFCRCRRCVAFPHCMPLLEADAWHPDAEEVSAQSSESAAGAAVDHPWL